MSGRADKAFTLAEVLIATALLAVLAAAVAVAVRTAVLSYTENEAISTTTQAARSVLARMMREVRTAEAVDSTSTSLTILPVDDGGGVTQIRYVWSSGTLTYHQTKDGTTTSEVLLGPNRAATAQSFTVSRQTGLVGGVSVTKTVTATITFSAGGQAFTATASADVRRNQEY